MTYHVEPFSGGLIRAERQAWTTDFHVCDERGRTVEVVPWSLGGSLEWRANRATTRARRLSGRLTTARRGTRGRLRWYCLSCHTSWLGGRRPRRWPR